MYRITASGVWGLDSPKDCGPDGLPERFCVHTPIVQGWPWGALIVRVGSGQPFGVGRLLTFKPETEGVISFRINHPPTDLADEPGGKIDVVIEKLEEQATSVTSPPSDVVPLYTPIPRIAASWRSPGKTRIVAAGISAYNDSGIPKVDYGAGDAQAFVTLARQAGVPAENITMLVGAEATRSKVIEAINRLKTATMDKSETAIFYFSGHGAPLVRDGSAHGSVVVPYDASEQDLEHTGINLDLIREKLGDLPGKSIVILDACFAGKEGRSVMAKNLRGLAIVPRDTAIFPPSGTNTWWLTATSGDNFANDLPKESHGLFTYYLLRALSGEQGVDADENGLVTITEAFAWTKEKVTTVSAKSLGRLQVPELIGYGDTNGTAVVSFMVVDAYVIYRLFRHSRRGSCIMG